MTPERWKEAVAGLLTEHARAFTIKESETRSGGIVVVVVEHARGGFVSLFMGSKQSTRGYALGWAADRPKVTSGMYTGQNWHRRLVRDAWKALDDVARS